MKNSQPSCVRRSGESRICPSPDLVTRLSRGYRATRREGHLREDAGTDACSGAWCCLCLSSSRTWDRALAGWLLFRAFSELWVVGSPCSTLWRCLPLPSLVGIWAALALRPSPSSRVASSAHPLSWRTSPRLILSSPLTYSVPWCHGCHWEARFSASAFVRDDFVCCSGLSGPRIDLFTMAASGATWRCHFCCFGFSGPRDSFILLAWPLGPRAIWFFAALAFLAARHCRLSSGPLGAQAMLSLLRPRPFGAARSLILLAQPLGPRNAVVFVGTASRGCATVSFCFLCPLGPCDIRFLCRSSWPCDAAVCHRGLWGHTMIGAFGAHVMLWLLQLRPFGAARSFILFARPLGPCATVRRLCCCSLLGRHNSFICLRGLWGHATFDSFVALAF